MICAMPVIPNAVTIGLSFQENFLYLSMNGTIANVRINNPGQATPVTNLSYWVLRNAKSPVRYHSGTVIPGGTVGSNLNPRSIGNTPPVIKIAPEIAMTIGTSNTRKRGKWTAISPSITTGKNNIISCKSFKNCYSAKNYTGYPQYFISNFVSSTKELIVHV